jgi:predicted dienelactone hydrolase
MRPLEWAILALLLATMLTAFRPSDRGWRHWTVLPVVLAFVAVVAHFMLEGYRWQMTPAYFATAVAVLVVIRRALGTPRNAAPGGRRILVRVGAAVLLLGAVGIAAALSLAFPIFELPAPTGSYAVGTVRASVVDPARPEIFTAELGDFRALSLQAWYPADAATLPGRPEKLWGGNGELSVRLAQSLNMPGFIFSHLRLIATHSFPEARLSGDHEKYPVLVFSHGYGQGFTAQNTVLMEELASHGYVVVSIGHPYESSAAVFPGRGIISLSDERANQVRAELAGASAALQQKIAASTSEEERSALIRQLIAASPMMRESLNVWTADTRFVLDWLERDGGAGLAPQFAGRLDFERIGVLGMSFGGSVAGQVCLLDERVKAGVNLDGLQYGDLLERRLSTPFLFMSSEEAHGLNLPMYEHAAGRSYYLTVRGSRHFDFTDFPLVVPGFKTLGVLGSVDGARMVGMYTAYTLAFFDQFLKGEASPLLDGPSSQFPEVELRARNSAPLINPPIGGHPFHAGVVSQRCRVEARDSFVAHKPHRCSLMESISKMANAGYDFGEPRLAILIKGGTK